MRLLRRLLFAILLATPAGAAELKLATWNIAWLTLRPAGDPALPRALPRRDAADLDRLAAYAGRLDADVVALQEVDGPAAAARILDPRAYAFFFPAEDDIQRTGFAVKRTLTARQNPDLAGLDLRPRARLSLRRGTDITVDTAAGSLRLLSLHLSAGCREGAIAAARDENCADLARQAAILAGWIAAREREGTAFAILGDLNRRLGTSDDPFLAALGEPGALVRPAAGLSNPCWADAGGGRPFIDHILLNPPPPDASSPTAYASSSMPSVGPNGATGCRTTARSACGCGPTEGHPRWTPRPRPPSSIAIESTRAKAARSRSMTQATPAA